MKITKKLLKEKEACIGTAKKALENGTEENKKTAYTAGYASKITACVTYATGYDDYVRRKTQKKNKWAELLKED